MELSYFLAQIFGLTLAIFAVAGIVRPKLITEALKDLNENSFSAIIAGFIGIVGGLAIILSHNIWEVNFQGVITLLGWGALLKGATYVIAPEFLMGTARKVYGTGNRQRIVLIIALILGVYLAYMGFVH